MAVHSDNKHRVSKAARGGGGLLVLKKKREVLVAEMVNLKTAEIRN